MKKKVAIFTMPFRFGYGGIMQAYALQTVLERMGYDVTVVQVRQGYYAPPRGLRAIVIYGKRTLFRLLRLSTTPVFAEKKYNAEWPVITSQIHQFIKEHIHLREINSINELKEEDYDTLVVGSDQVWRNAYCDVTQYLFRFAENWDVQRIAYAASFGIAEKEYSDELVSKCKPLALLFDAISVREDSGVSLCKEYYGVNAQHVLDPTMLLDKVDYDGIISKSNTSSSGGALFSYILDDSTWKRDVVRQIATEQQLCPFSINVCGDNRQLSVEERIQPSVEQWLRAFVDSDFVVTDSFHGCVFSVLFKKPFIALANSERGNTRIDSLLRVLSLESRSVSIDTDIKSLLQTQIDWERVYANLIEWRQKSMSFISENLL